MFLLIILGLPLVHLAWWWSVTRIWRDRRARWAVHAFGAALLGSYAWIMAARILGRESAPPLLLLTATYVWFLLVLPWGALLTAAALILRGKARPATPRGPDADAPPASQPTRRALLAAGLSALPPLTAAAGVAIAIPRLTTFRIRRLDVALAALPRALDGLTIAHLSDTHVGRLVDERLLRCVADATNALRPDLVLFTGDLIDFSLAYLPAGIDLLRRVEPRHGRYVVEGNHDLFDDRQAFTDRMHSANVGLLLNEAATLDARGVPVQILGVRWAGRVRGSTLRGDPLGETLARRDAAAFGILLAHHPHDFDRAAAAGVPLTLAGHTHGGQLMLSDALGAGPALFRYWSGLYRRGSAALVVSNGVGNWFPLRINAPAEIIHITLRCRDA